MAVAVKDFDGYELILSSLWIGSCLREIFLANTLTGKSSFLVLVGLVVKSTCQYSGRGG